MVTFRPLSHADYPMLLGWLRRSHVREWWDDGDDTLEKVAAHYSRDAEHTKRFVAVLDGRPVGYFQYHRVSDNLVATDQFLADENLLSQGLGTTALLAFIELIARCEQPKSITVDPRPENLRAIRCYEKCGFVHDHQRSTPSTHFMTRTTQI